MSEPTMGTEFEKVGRYEPFSDGSIPTDEHGNRWPNEYVSSADYDALLALHKASLERERVLQAKLDKSESRRQFAFLQAALADAELPVDFMPDSDPAERLGHFVEACEVAESQLRELREIVGEYRHHNEQHGQCCPVDHFRYVESVCPICIKVDLFLKKVEVR